MAGHYVPTTLSPFYDAYVADIVSSNELFNGEQMDISP